MSNRENSRPYNSKAVYKKLAEIYRILSSGTPPEVLIELISDNDNPTRKDIQSVLEDLAIKSHATMHDSESKEREAYSAIQKLHGEIKGYQKKIKNYQREIRGYQEELTWAQRAAEQKTVEPSSDSDIPLYLIKKQNRVINNRARKKR